MFFFKLLAIAGSGIFVLAGMKQLTGNTMASIEFAFAVDLLGIVVLYSLQGIEDAIEKKAK